MIITIDFDNTLTQKSIQELAKWIVNFTRHEVFILTKRYDTLLRKQFQNLPSNDMVFEIAEEVGIEPSNIIFTNQQSKLFHVQRANVGIHIDDDKYELENIRENTMCKVFNSTEENIVERIQNFILELDR